MTLSDKIRWANKLLSANKANCAFSLVMGDKYRAADLLRRRDKIRLVLDRFYTRIDEALA